MGKIIKGILALGIAVTCGLLMKTAAEHESKKKEWRSPLLRKE